MGKMLRIISFLIKVVGVWDNIEWVVLCMEWSRASLTGSVSEQADLTLNLVQEIR